MLTIALIEKAFAQPLKRAPSPWPCARSCSASRSAASPTWHGSRHGAVGDGHPPEGDRRALLAGSLATFVAFATAVGALA